MNRQGQRCFQKGGRKGAWGPSRGQPLPSPPGQWRGLQPRKRGPLRTGGRAGIEFAFLGVGGRIGRSVSRDHAHEVTCLSRKTMHLSPTFSRSHGAPSRSPGKPQRGPESCRFAPLWGVKEPKREQQRPRPRSAPRPTLGPSSDPYPPGHRGPCPSSWGSTPGVSNQGNEALMLATSFLPGYRDGASKTRSFCVLFF